MHMYISQTINKKAGVYYHHLQILEHSFSVNIFFIQLYYKKNICQVIVTNKTILKR